MEYKVAKNNSEVFWEDRDDNSFGLGEELTIKFNKDLITIQSNGAEAYLHREGKMAKVSAEGQIIKGMVKEKDRLVLGKDEVVIEFSAKQNLKESFKIKLPKIEINWNLWAGVGILLLLVIVVFSGWKRTTETKAESNYQKVLGEIKNSLSKADDVKSIDPDTSLKLLNEAKDKLSIIKTNKKHEKETMEVEKQINDKLTVSGSIEVVGYAEVYDTRIADTVDRMYDRMELKDNLATLADSKSKRVVQINLETKSVSKFELSLEIGEVVEVITLDKKFYIYDGRYLWEQGKTKGLDLGEEVFSKIINWNRSWYLLGQKGNVAKTTDGKISKWTDDKATLIDKPVGMAIDGTVWVVSSGGEVQNYERGADKKWVSSIKITNEQVVGITTMAGNQRVVIVSDKKVYVFEKSSGKLIASHSFEKIGIIDARMGTNDQVFVLAKDQKIYKVK